MRSNGSVRDLRLPLADGEQIQLLTTRDKDDPDALYVLRHSTRAPARRGRAAALPGREDRDRPADRQRLLLRLRVPRADHARTTSSGSRPRSRASSTKVARWSREEISADDARARFAAEGEPYKVELVDTAEGDRSRSTRRTTSPTSAAARTCRTRSRSRPFKLTSLAGAYWRGDEHKHAADADLRHRVLSQDDLDAHLERIEEARKRDHRRLGVAARPLPPRRDLAGLAVLAPEGHGDLERARGPAPARERRRGYVEVKTPLIYDKSSGSVGPLGEVPREHVPDPEGRSHLRRSSR